MSAELEQVTLAVAAINKVEAGLAALRETYGAVVYQVTTTDGMEAAKAARAAVREPRYEVERIRKAAKAPILALGKKLDTEAARITGELEKIENPIHQQIKSEEDRKEKEREDKIAAELARTQEIQRRLDGIRNWPVNAANQPAILVGQMLTQAQAFRIETDVFQERSEEATAILAASTAALAGILQQRKDHEAEQAQLEIDRKELARLKAEETERQRLAAETQAKAEAEAHAKQVADARAHAEQIRLDREKLAREEADAKAIIESERKKVADQRAENDRANEAERVKQAEGAALLISQREAFEAEQRALEEARRPKPIVEPKIRTKIKTPSREEILQVIASHYQVDQSIVRYWLSGINWAEVAA